MKFLALLVLCGLAMPARADLSEAEQRIVEAVRQRSPAALQLLERAVRVNSGTLNTAGVRAAGGIFRAELEGLGFATRRVEMPESMRRAGHVVASRAGTWGQRLLEEDMEIASLERGAIRAAIMIYRLTR